MVLFIFFDILLQPNAATEDDVTPLLSAVAAGSLACLELLVQVSPSSNYVLLIFHLLWGAFICNILDHLFSPAFEKT